jgi:hypothetical protein
MELSRCPVEPYKPCGFPPASDTPPTGRPAVDSSG